MASQDTSIGLDIKYLKSIDSGFKIGEIVVSLIVFICACVWGTWGGGGWVQFVSIAAFLVFAALFILKLSRIINKVPEVLPILFAEFAIYALWVIMYIISGFVAAVQGFHPPAAVSAFFSFACGLGFGVDAFIKFRDWREGGSTPRPQPTAETGTTPTDQARSTGQY